MESCLQTVCFPSDAAAAVAVNGQQQFADPAMMMSCAGFLQQFAGVCRPEEPEKNMGTVVEQLSNGRTPTRVLCCGHSLGGALATLGAHLSFASNLSHHGPMVHHMCLCWSSNTQRGINTAVAKLDCALALTNLSSLRAGQVILSQGQTQLCQGWIVLWP